MQTLYASGARKFIIPNIGGVGCVPTIGAFLHLPLNECDADIDKAVTDYNQLLKQALVSLAANLPRVHIVYANVYTLAIQLATRPNVYGESLCPRSKEFTEQYIS